MAVIPNLLSRANTGRVILALSLAASLPTWSQGNWRSLSLPPSGTVTVLHAVGERLLAGTGQGRIFASEDGGRSWIPTLLSGEAPASAILASGNELYAAFGTTGLDPVDCAPTGHPCSFPSQEGSLHRSLDQGRTWSPAGYAGVSALAVRGPELYIANGSGLYKTTGGNPAWQTVSRLYGGSLTTGIFIRRAFAGMEWMGTSWMALVAADGTNFSRGTLLRGVPSGDTLRWSLVLDSVPAMAKVGTALVICKEEPTTDGTPDRRVLRSPDAGVTWERKGAVDCRNLRASGNRLFAAVEGPALRVSLDTGATWQTWGPPLAEGFTLQTLMEHAGSLHAGGAGTPSILTLEAGAQAWKAGAEGLRDMPVTGLLVRGGAVLAADHAGTYVLPALASSRWRTPLLWNSRNVPASLASTGDLVLALGDALYSTRNPLDSGRWVLGEAQPVRALAAGERWAAVWTEAISATEAENGLRVCGEDGLPGCREPARANLPQPQYFAITRMAHRAFRGMAIQGDTLAVVLDSLYLSVDRGESFRSYRPPDRVGFLGFHGGALFAGGWDSLRVWRGDGGWEPVPVQGVQGPADLRAMASRPGALFVAGTIGVFRRRDGGAEWEDLNQGLPHTAVRSLDVEDGLLVVGLEAGGVWARELEPAGTRPRARRQAPVLGYPGRYPTYRAASGAWRRIDGRAAAGSR